MEDNLVVYAIVIGIPTIVYIIALIGIRIDRKRTDSNIEKTRDP